MGVYIKGMEMPTRCAECRLSTVHSFNDRPLCDVLVEYMSYGEWEAKRLDNCPLVPVPPHRRLIEAEPIMKFITDGLNSGEFGYDQIKVLTEIQYAPTIIPAEEGEI